MGVFQLYCCILSTVPCILSTVFYTLLPSPSPIQRAEALGKRFQALKIVNRQKIVDMRQHRLHPAHARLVGFAP